MEFNPPLSNKTDAELKGRIENRQKYMPETVQAAIAELQQRGHLFTDEELKTYNDDIQERLRIAASEKKAGAIFSKEYNYNVVEDPDAPLLYSRRAVYLFTILGTALFGAILLAINSRKIEHAKRSTVWILLAGAAYTALQITFVNYAHSSNSLNFLWGLVAGIAIDYFFLPIVGNATFYRARPVLVPLIILLVGYALIIWAVLA